MKIKISDLNIPELDYYRLYNENQLRKIYEPNPGLFICESSKVILRAISAGYELVSALTAIENPDEETAKVYDACKDAPIYLGDDSVLRELAGYALTGGILAAMKRKPLPNAESIISGKSRIAVLENVNNPTNVGAIFRCAAALGIEAILISHDCSDPFYRRTERVSMGTVFQIPWTRIKKDEDIVNILRKNGFATVSMALSNKAVSIRDPRIKEEKKIAIILGNEGYGLKKETIEKSDYVAMIPMSNEVDSLNVAAAGAVIFWEICK